MREESLEHARWASARELLTVYIDRDQQSPMGSRQSTRIARAPYNGDWKRQDDGLLTHSKLICLLRVSLSISLFVAPVADVSLRFLNFKHSPAPLSSLSPPSSVNYSEIGNGARADTRPNTKRVHPSLAVTSFLTMDAVKAIGERASPTASVHQPVRKRARFLYLLLFVRSMTLAFFSSSSSRVPVP